MTRPAPASLAVLRLHGDRHREHTYGNSCHECTAVDRYDGRSTFDLSHLAES
jgi:hypothetical protein